MKIPHNRDELAEDAKEAAEYVSKNFFDDWLENISWVFLGALIGYAVRWITG